MRFFIFFSLHFSKHYPFQFILHSFSRIFIKMDNNLISYFSNLLYSLCSCIMFIFIFVYIIFLLLVAIKKDDRVLFLPPFTSLIAIHLITLYHLHIKFSNPYCSAFRQTSYDTYPWKIPLSL